jgi:diguanylate cyclase (GGDEF)-like protein
MAKKPPTKEERTALSTLFESNGPKMSRIARERAAHQVNDPRLLRAARALAQQTRAIEIAKSKIDEWMSEYFDIAQEKVRLEDDVNTDILTGLPNRRGFIKQLHDRIIHIRTQEEGSTQTAVVFIDLDGFKDLNDNLGHPIGDAALKEIAKRLKSVFRRTGDVVGRIGGDEMVLFLPFDEKRKINVEVVRRKIDEALDGLVFWKDGQPFPIGASIGLKVFDKVIFVILLQKFSKKPMI